MSENMMSEGTRAKRSHYKICIVPDCKSTSNRYPNKLFFCVPLGERRKVWCRAMGRREPDFEPLNPSSVRFCCEDHFDIENDMENFMRWKMMSSLPSSYTRLKLKKDVIPHKFSCQNRVIIDTCKQIEITPVDIKEEASNTEYVVACESDIIHIEDSELSDSNDDSIHDQCNQIEITPVDIKEKLSDTDDVVASESDVIVIEDSKLSDFKDDSIDYQCKQIEITPVNIEEEASDTDDIIACESDIIDVEDSKLRDSKDDSIDDQCRPYIVSIICVKTRKRRLT